MKSYALAYKDLYYFVNLKKFEPKKKLLYLFMLGEVYSANKQMFLLRLMYTSSCGCLLAVELF